MFPKVVAKVFLCSTIFAMLIPASAMAQHSRGNSGGARGYSAGRSERGYAPRGNYSDRDRGSYNRGYYSRGYYYQRPVYLGYTAPYVDYGSGYGYDPGPPPPPPACNQGYYDRYGNWVPTSGCYSGPQPPVYYSPR